MKTKAQLLASAGGSHEAAFEALYGDYSATVTALNAAETEAEKNAGDSIRARVIAEALEPLAEAHGLTLPPKGQKPAKNALEALQGDVQGALEDMGNHPALAMLGVVMERLNLDADAFEEAFKKLPENASEADVLALVDSTLKPVTEPLGRVASLEGEKLIGSAAKFAGVDSADLLEFLGDRKPTTRTVKEGDADVEQYGLGEGDAFKPLTEFKAVQALAGTPLEQVKKPPIVTGGAGGKPGPSDPVADLNKRLFGGKKE